MSPFIYILDKKKQNQFVRNNSQNSFIFYLQNWQKIRQSL